MPLAWTAWATMKRNVEGEVQRRQNKLGGRKGTHSGRGKAPSSGRGKRK